MSLAAWPAGTAPVEAAYIEALARRAAGHEGPLRVLLDAKLAEARARCATALSDHTRPALAPATLARCPGPLAELTARLDRGSASGSAVAASTVPTGAGTPPELKSLQRDREAWARLSVEQELQRALAQVPDNPGPLNSHLLVLRSLRLMQDLSPAYLARFVSQLETLVWLDQASFGTLPMKAPTKPPVVPRRNAAAERKRARPAGPSTGG